MSRRNLNNYTSKYIQDKKNFARNRTFDSEEGYKHTAEKKQENEEKYGTHDELIPEGTKDRIIGNSPKKFEDESMQKSYSYGYYERGSRVLAGSFEKSLFTKQMQIEFGMKDLNNGVKDSQLGNLKECAEYMYGRIYQMGRNIYDYVEKNNIIIEEYIELMSFITPEIRRKEFKQGYYDEKENRKTQTKSR